MTDIKAELQRIVAAARAQGKVGIEATAVSALARIEELEAQIAVYRRGTIARVQSTPPARRREIARLAAARRWHKDAPAEHSQQ